MKPASTSRPERLHRPVQAMACAAAVLLAWAAPLPVPQRIAASVAAGLVTTWLASRFFKPASFSPVDATDSGALQEARESLPREERRAATRPAPLALPALVPKTHRDALTGLPTRACLEESGDDLLPPLAAPGAEACVLCLEVVGLAGVIERYGPAAADTLRQQLATRLRRLARRSDTLLRLEGDRYLLLMGVPLGDGAVLARAMASRAVADLQRPLAYRTLSNLRVDCCIGAAIGPVSDLPSLARRVDEAGEALQAALAVGRGQFRQHVADFAEEPVAA
jgi:diguanylate cyclase (GGDEF)-like protein